MKTTRGKRAASVPASIAERAGPRVCHASGGFSFPQKFL
ncbi:hypothetical protein DNTS_000405 [Danionella cerebrum]|uniref:Uncharacterized protein n=1 Tax=Danionella cerebrum TaxID=2873325 RepID=A0A553MZF3_9TELE|nr:hypothetical protein DNTS_000405 [Danionella translucida]